MKKSCHKVTAVIPALLLVACVDNRNDFTGVSPNSEETTASLPAPENLSATASDNEVSLSWDTVDGASAYNVYIYNQSDYIQSNYSPTNLSAADAGASAIVSTNSHLLSSLEYEVDYYFNVTALADDLESNQSNEVGVRPLQSFSNSTPSVQLLNTNVNAAEVVTLSAEVSDPDGNNISYLWQQTSGASVDIVDSNESEATFTAPTVDAPVELGFALTVFDNLGASSTSSATVTVSDNLSPQVDAGADQSVSPGATVDLLGSASDADGSVVDIAWQQESGSIVSLSSNSTLDTSFTAPSANSSELTLVFQLSATDDRGASSTDTVSVIVAADQAITTIYRVEVAENSNGTIHVATTMDPEQESLTYGLSGTDVDDFSIDSSSGAISFVSTPDYETPTDANTDNAYELTFAVSNGTTTTLQELVITVTDVDEAPTITSAPSTSTSENTTTTFTASATDPESNPLSYSLSGTDAANFAINPSSGAISFTTIPDYENPADSDANNVYALTLEVSDSTHTTSQALSITVTNIDEAPSITSASSTNILENTITTIYTASASDPENDTLSYSLSATDAAHFSIAPSSGAISFAVNPDHENPADANADNIYELTLEVSDSTHTTSQALAITVDDANDNAPIITAAQSFSIDENSATGTIIGTVIATDVDTSPTTYQDWTITSGDTNTAFAIDSSSGEITVADASKLDYETEPTSYNLSITVSDGVNTSSTETVTINVNDLNDNTPVITASQSFSIDENGENGASIGTVAATDGDATATTYQDWKITGGNTDNAFGIDSSSGEITVADGSQLDYETDPTSYNLSITVSDGTNTSSAETVTINVNDLNDNTPVITASQIFGIDENSEDGTVVGTVEVSDGDVTATTYQDWKITGGNTDNAFDINSSSGEITVADASQLDYETEPNSYNLSITVSDGSTTSSAETVTINVTDLNDNTPVITASQSFSVDENSANASSVGTVVVTDADVTATTYQDWKITGGNTDNAFDINSSSGEITVADASQLDYETEPNSYNLSITVSDGSTTSSAETVTINVTDLNDNTPVITASQSFSVDENSANASSVGTVVVTDADATTTTYQDWTIASGDTNNAFAIDPSSGEITVQTSSALDYDNGATSYTLILTVSDGTNTSSAETVTINVNDLNDNTPVITASQNFDINENSANGTSVGTVVATDADATTTTYQDWTITSGDTNNAFAIDPSSGEISVQTSSELDYDNGATSYTLILTVSDGTNTSSAETVTINVNDINDNTPVITASQNFDINENSANGTSVGTVVATDADATTTTYQDWTITSGDTNNAFAIDPSSGEISVQTSSELDYDNGATSYTLILTVSDGTNTSSAETVIINVKDLNDNTPVITASQSFNIDENSTNATSVGTVVATDADATTTTYQDWTIASGDTNNAFAIDPSSGEITVQTSSALDYDNGATSYTLILTVSDGTNTSSAETVTINVNDLNDNTPVITASQNFDINENSANGTSVGTVVATDADATTTTYQDWTITSGDTNNAFAIDPSSGEISVQTSSELDYDNGATSYTLILTVSDGTNTSSAETVIINVNDLNDNTPVITASQNFNIDENSANATSVGTVVATDADATTTTYQDWTITSGDTNNAFAIDPSSGEISVQTSSELDYDNGATSYTLILTVSDGTNTSSAETVTINVNDLNDNTPVIIASQSFNIDENSANATSVGTVVATDADATTTTYQDWTITSGDTNNAFAIDPSSGEITVQTSSELDYDNGATSYTLILTVSDGTNTSSAETVTINVNDLNDNTPVITASQSFNIDENSANATSVGTVVATDADATTTTYQDWTITSGDTNNAFAIDPSSGEITVQTSSELDYDNGATSYTLILTVSDGTNTSSAETVIINVKDLNDNTPVITASQSFNIDENSANATSVGTVVATDADATTTTYQDWTIASGDTNNAFAIDPSSGEITVQTSSALDYDNGATSYTLILTVSDGTNTSSAETVTINVNDLNDNTPVITASQNFDINENSANGTSVGTVVATDADATTTTYQDWTITSGDTNNAFAIDPSSGEISVQTSSELDYDNGATSYTLILTVSDGTNTSSAETVTINVNDINDNTPVITASQSFNIDENSANATSVGTVVASDADATATTYQDWKIAGGNTNNAFAIDSDTGEITVNASTELDTETTPGYSLSITVSDGANTSNAETVTVNVTDINDNTPVITASQSFNIDENSANATSVGTVVATDADATTTTYQDWTITSGDTNNAFAIDPSSGEITVQTSSELDYDNGATSYTLILTVSDGTNTSSAETVTINVNDINDNTPVIIASQSFNIDENSANATSVGTVVATDADATTTTYQDWTIASGDTNSAFAIDSDTGEITVNTSSELDTETTPSYSLSITVSDGTNTSSAETVTINVNDLNDNTPVIIASQSFNIDENSANATSVGTVVATDADATTTTYQDWTITSGDTNNAFAIDPSSGEITVQTSSELDYDNGATSYTLILTVSDGTNTSSAETVIINVKDLNDNTPVITASQSFNIDENSANATSVGTVVATDADATTTTYQDWTIASGDTNNAFAIDPSSGEITVQTSSALDYDNGATSYTLILTVSDGTNTSSAETVTINVNDLNDNTPVITASQNFDINENSANGTSVGTVVATDADATTTTYQDWTITSGDTNNAFAIDPSSGEISVQTSSELDYDNGATSYTLILTVSDGTNTSSAETVTINVNDINDNTPVITASQSFNIDENSANATSVGTVVASDADATATTYQDWKIAGGNTNNAFAIDSDTGEITVNASTELDTETTPGYSLSITVSDGANTSNAETVTVNVTDINDNTPVITASQSFNIDENSANATSVGTVVATDADATTTTYQDWTITSGDTNNAFAIDPSSGEITVQTSSELDYDNGATSYTLILTVSDGTNTSSAETVTINVNDINDNTPVIIASQSFNIDENSANATSVGTVVATDADATTTTYQDWTIASGDTNSAFAIDSDTGEITVNTSSELDTETTPSYSLSITVSDGTNTSSAETVTINVNDLNDNTPVIIASQSFNIDENSANATSVGTVVATDADATTTTYQDWTITSGDTNNAFAIDPSSGEITVQTSSELDYDNGATSYTLILTVSDGTNTSSAETVTINVNDLNDNTPVITASQSFNIDENSANATSVGTVVASDADATTTTYQDWTITSGDTNNAFAIDPSSGEITVQTSSELDYDNGATSYTLILTVSDGTNTSSAETVTINVNDINDNTPVITASQSFNIDENSANATSVGTVAASDADATATTYQDWKIAGGNTNNAFAIDPDTGEITVNTSSELDTETTPSYSLSITVSDGANTATAETVTININDLNDNTPIITPSQSFDIDEASANGTSLGTVAATDADTTATTYQNWTITAGNTNDAFAIDPSTGEITVNTSSELDYESGTILYTLSLTVSDGATTSSAETVTINILDVSEHDAAPNAAYLGLPDNYINITFTPESGVSYQLHRSFVEGCTSSSCDAEGYQLFASPNSSGTADTMTFSQTHYYSLVGDNSTTFTTSINDSDGAKLAALVAAQSLSTEYDLANDWVNISATDSNNVTYTLYMAGEPFAAGGCEDSELDNIGSLCADGSSLSDGSMHSATEVINWSARRYYRLDISDGYQVVHSLESNASVIDPVVLNASNASLTIDITWSALNSAKLAEYTVYLSEDSAATTASAATWSSLSNSRIISGNSSELYSLVPILSQYYVAITATNTGNETTPLSKVYLVNNIVTGDPDPSTWHEIIADTDDSPAHWEGRSTHGSLVFQDKMWLIGGRTASENHIAEVWSSTDGYNWTEVTPSAAFGARKEFVSMVHDGKMWVLGGEIEGNLLANDVWYSSDGATWHEATPAASWHVRDYFGGVAFASGATGSDEMWVLGHYTGDARGIPGVEDHHYSTDGSTWSSVSVSGLPPSSFFPAITFNNVILIVGGYFYTNSAWSESNTIYSSTDGVNWAELSVSGSIWDARRLHTTLVYDDKLWILAGYSGYNRDDYWYSPDGTQWHEVMASGSKWEARQVHTSVNYAGRMWMLGGYGSTGDKQLNDVWASGLEITSFSFNPVTTN